MAGWIDREMFELHLIMELMFERSGLHLEMVGRAGGTNVHLGPVFG